MSHRIESDMGVQAETKKLRENERQIARCDGARVREQF